MDVVSSSLNAKRWAVLLALVLLACFLCLPLSAQSNDYSYMAMDFYPPQATTETLVTVQVITGACLIFDGAGTTGAPETRVVVNGSNIDIYQAGNIARGSFCVYPRFQTDFLLPKLKSGNYTVSIYLVDSGASYQRNYRIGSGELNVMTSSSTYKEISRVPSVSSVGLLFLALSLICAFFWKSNNTLLP